MLFRSNYDRQATAQIAESDQAAPALASGSKKPRKSKDRLTFEGKMNLPASGPASTPQSALEQALAPGQGNGQTSQNPPPVVHSDAGDAWKGLIFSLQASKRTAEAFQQIAQIPPDVRQQLEGDVDFMQVVASLYVANGDIPHATEYLNRVENYYMLRRLTPPPGVDVQNAWLLLNTGNDHDLYPALKSLDARRDLTRKW